MVFVVKEQAYLCLTVCGLLLFESSARGFGIARKGAMLGLSPGCYNGPHKEAYTDRKYGHDP